ncbi:MAG TPA: nucleoside deaminase [Actinocrinis sp.]|uniref:nucleoside deaminase n=1 Tax=Actinocrinis sp. TaxID=1920516 RepID=UPI002DDD8A9E|nr:nucleoside deaminase [Actinocrinis sp.]HEV2348168.1 nucleoside deaminase [Actinocrinis sp.]
MTPTPSAPTSPAPAAPSGPPALPNWLVARYTPWMREALAEAEQAPRTGDVPIGAVVVNAEGQIVGRGRNVREADADPVGHAEIVALRAAAQTTGAWRLSGHTLVVTLEPCAMCAGAAVLARVDRIVFAAFDPKAGAAGSLWDIPRDHRLNHRPEVVAGILAAESHELLEKFFASHRPVR